MRKLKRQNYLRKQNTLWCGKGEKQDFMNTEPSDGGQRMWAVVLVLLSLCSSAHRDEEEEREKGGRLTNCPSSCS